MIKFLERLLKAQKYPRVQATVSRYENPNDWRSRNGVMVTFTDEHCSVVGVACVSGIDTESPFLYNLEVYPKYRNLGYGHSIMKYLVEYGGVNILTVDEDNEKAINLYKEFGFLTTGYSFDDQHNEVFTMRLGNPYPCVLGLELRNKPVDADYKVVVNYNPGIPRISVTPMWVHRRKQKT